MDPVSLAADEKVAAAAPVSKQNHRSNSKQTQVCEEKNGKEAIRRTDYKVADAAKKQVCWLNSPDKKCVTNDANQHRIRARIQKGLLQDCLACLSPKKMKGKSLNCLTSGLCTGLANCVLTFRICLLTVAHANWEKNYIKRGGELGRTQFTKESKTKTMVIMLSLFSNLFLIVFIAGYPYRAAVRMPLLINDVEQTANTSK